MGYKCLEMLDLKFQTEEAGDQHLEKMRLTWRALKLGTWYRITGHFLQALASLCLALRAMWNGGGCQVLQQLFFVFGFFFSFFFFCVYVLMAVEVLFERNSYLYLVWRFQVRWALLEAQLPQGLSFKLKGSSELITLVINSYKWSVGQCLYEQSPLSCSHMYVVFHHMT